MDRQEGSFGQRLRFERDRLHLSQEHLAKKIGGSIPSIQRWENDRAIPRADMLQKLCEIFGKTENQWGRKELIWSVPFLRNHYFTGRERILARLHKALTAENTVASTQICVICGLGGIGKTQTALEYVYRYSEEYEAVFWIHADSEDMLRTDMMALADLIHLPERQEANQNRVIAAVRQWLEKHGPWLLIFDNVEDIEMILTFFPKRPGGAILLTTRSQVIRAEYMKKIDLDKMESEEAVHFLFHRITDEEYSRTASSREWEAAKHLWEIVGGLPLALDQAAAYIEESQSDIAEYVALYQTHRAPLLKRRGSWREREYPDSVAATWLLAFEQVEQISIAARDLLLLCAFLHPDAIPEEMLIATVTQLESPLKGTLSDVLLLKEAISVLRRYSLVSRNSKAKTLTIHRLVQAVIKDRMSQEERRQWAKQTIQMVNHSFPDEEAAPWLSSQRYLPHALVCVAYIPYWTFSFPEAADLSCKIGVYLRSRGQYREAEPFLLSALTIRESLLGPEHATIASSLNHLANVSIDQGKYEEAEALYRRALAINENVLGSEHSDTAMTLHNLALLDFHKGKYEEAEALYQHALSIQEKLVGLEHPKTAQILDNLANLRKAQGRYEQAASLQLRALAINEKVLGSEHPKTTRSLCHLANVYADQGKYNEAESLYQRALAIEEQVLGPEDPRTLMTLNNLTSLYANQGQYEKAEPLYQRNLAIQERILGSEHPDTALSLYNLANIYKDLKKYEKAEPLFQRALMIYEQLCGSNHPDTADTIHDLACLYQEQGKYEQAELLYQRTLTIREQVLGDSHPHTCLGRKNYALLLRHLGREQEAAALEVKNKC